jgi:hypothetical protein
MFSDRNNTLVHVFRRRNNFFINRKVVQKRECATLRIEFVVVGARIRPRRGREEEEAMVAEDPGGGVSGGASGTMQWQGRCHITSRWISVGDDVALELGLRLWEGVGRCRRCLRMVGVPMELRVADRHGWRGQVAREGGVGS